MNCLECGSPMAVRRTMRGGTDRAQVTTREHVCDCGQRYVSEQRITRRLTAISITGAPQGTPPDGIDSAALTAENSTKNAVPCDSPIKKGEGGLSDLNLSGPLIRTVEDPSPKVITRSDPARAKRQETSAFQAFYAAFPRKVARDAAWRMWVKVGAESVAAAIMDAITWQTLDVFSAAPADKIPHPATWLHAGRWKDEQPRKALYRAPRVPGPPVAVAELFGARAAQLEAKADQARKLEADRFRQAKEQDAAIPGEAKESRG